MRREKQCTSGPKKRETEQLRVERETKELSKVNGFWRREERKGARAIEEKNKALYVLREATRPGGLNGREMRSIRLAK